MKLQPEAINQQRLVHVLLLSAALDIWKLRQAPV
jgi:hypothetical protein